MRHRTEGKDNMAFVQGDLRSQPRKAHREQRRAKVRNAFGIHLIIAAMLFVSSPVMAGNPNTETPTRTPTITKTPTITNTPTNTMTDTPTNTPTKTPTNTFTDTPTRTPTDTPTYTSTNTPTCTPTQTPTDTPTATETVSVSLVVEDNVTETMEGRDLTFTATASSNFPCGLTNPMLFTFNYQTAAGTPWTSEDWSTDRVEDNTATADDVLAGDADHKFTTPIFAEAANDGRYAVSNTINIDVYELWIRSVSDAAELKPWKVVVGKDIAYAAISSNEAKNFSWTMPDGFPDQWSPTGGNAKTGTGMRIQNSDLPSSGNNDHFGTAYGTVNVFCEDAEGNNHSFDSTSMSPSQKASVFFERDAMTNPGGTTRNWFYYWKGGGVVSDLADFQYRDEGGFGEFNTTTHVLYVFNDAPTTETWDITYTNRYYQRQLRSGADGIANSAVPGGEDDVQVIPVSQGQPNQTAITAGVNGVLDSAAGGDDSVVGTTITTGANGVCITSASGDDVQLIPIGNGSPNSVIVTAGADSFLHTTAAGDDQLDLAGAQTVRMTGDYSGIDICAVCCTHEKKHKSNHLEAGTDTDGDGLVDSSENGTYHLDPNRTDTYNVEAAFGYPPYGLYGDNEFLARLEEQSPGARSPSTDWSDTNGKQW